MQMALKLDATIYTKYKKMMYVPMNPQVLRNHMREIYDFYAYANGLQKEHKYIHEINQFCVYTNEPSSVTKPCA